MSDKIKSSVNNTDNNIDQIGEFTTDTAKEIIKDNSANSDSVDISKDDLKNTVDKKSQSVINNIKIAKNSEDKATENFDDASNSESVSKKRNISENIEIDDDISKKNTDDSQTFLHDLSENTNENIELADSTHAVPNDAEPIIIIGGASEVVFEPAEGDESDIIEEQSIETEERKPKEKTLRIIEGGGKEIVIDDTASINEKLGETPACTRNKIKDKKIGDIGTYVAIGFFVVTIIISLFNIKGMRYPLSCLFLSLAALTMGITTILRILNNKKCDCATCKTQNKTFLYSVVLWFLVFLGALIAFLVLMFK